MRILTIISGRNLGGSKQVFFDYVAIFSRLGYEIVPVVRKGSKVHRRLIALFPEITSKIRFIYYFRCPYWPFKAIAANAYRKLHQEEKFDLVLFHKPIDLFFAFHAHLSCPLLLVLHTFSLRYLYCANHVIAVSESQLNFLKQHELKVPMSLRYNFLTSMPIEKNSVDQSVSKKFTLGTMCVLRGKKNLGLLLRACSILKQQNIAFKLIIAGSGTKKLLIYLYRFCLGLTDDVEIRPWVTNKQKFFEEIDLFCLTSLSETFNLTLIEAMAHGVPVISTSCEGPKEIITHGYDGYLVESWNAQDYANALVNIINNDEMRVNFAQRGAVKVREKFFIEGAAHDVNVILSNYLSRGDDK
ncbi:Glycosyltransferase family 1 protein [Rickettsiales endosymbiont of Paramecium tredecaurelia]|uniref:glycosyltransferase family 4 protein n=1 Tax=Candidatus Sarmatiella mevalonica TaxID=2770581 RepID=UPI001924DD3D|nr:glycosyltransferase family 4 protein [Candidatus Sarmatiella mevalonica]MBL3284392.1 Glycosyltransferase family 1 protein [Candidatus Sarmatiella mevalonica]